MNQNIVNYPKLQGYYQQNRAQQPNFEAGNQQISSGNTVVQNNPILSRVSQQQDENPAKMLLTAAGTTAAFLALNNYINNPLQTKDYNNTFFKTIEKNVDKFGSKPKVKAITNAIERFKASAKVKINNSEILSTLFHKPSIGGEMVQSQAAGAKGHLAGRAIEVMRKYCEESGYEDLQTLINKSESNKKLKLDKLLQKIKTLKSKKTVLSNPLDIIIQKIENGTINNVDDAISALKKQKASMRVSNKFNTMIKKAGKEGYKYYDEIINTIKTSGADINKVIKSNPWWGMGVIKNKASLKEIINKDILINNYKASGKTLGQKISGYLMRGAECVTNGLFSGKGQVVFQALMIAQSLKEASNAEKGEKFSTFMASWAELMTFLATMGIQMRVVNHLAGLKNMGMSVADVAKYQKAMKIANKAAAIGNHKAYAKMTRLMDNIKKAANTNIKWYQKPFKWVGQLFSFGRINETLKPLKVSKLGTMFAKVPYGLKVGLGYIGRVAFVMGVVMPLFSGIAKRISYAIFGKPVKTIEKQKAEEKAEEEKAKAEELKQQQEYEQKLAELQNKTTQPIQQPMQTAKAGNLLDQMNNKYNNPNQQIPTQPMYQQPSPIIANQPLNQQTITPIANTPIQQSPDAGIKRTYIPNPILGTENLQSDTATRTARINEVLRRADWAEMQASKYL